MDFSKLDKFMDDMPARGIPTMDLLFEVIGNEK